MDKFDGADIDTACRLADQQHARRALNFPGKHDFLLVAAREIGAFQIAIWRAHVIGLHFFRHVAAHCGAVEEQSLAQPPLIMMAENAALRCVKRHHQPGALAVLRNMQQPHGPALRRVHRCDINAAKLDAAAGQPPHSSQRLQQLCLPVAGDTRNADDFAAAQIKRNPVKPRDALAVTHRQIID